MATKTGYDTRKALRDYYVYAPLGAAQLLVEKGKELSGRAVEMSQTGWRNVTDTYRGLAERGEKLVQSIRGSASTQRAIEQTKVARTQVKAAATSVRKAVDRTADATKTAAKRVS